MLDSRAFAGCACSALPRFEMPWHDALALLLRSGEPGSIFIMIFLAAEQARQSRAELAG